jgi:hypothetical protein
MLFFSNLRIIRSDTFADSFHKFAVEWNETQIRYHVDILNIYFQTLDFPVLVLKLYVFDVFKGIISHTERTKNSQVRSIRKNYVIFVEIYVKRTLLHVIKGGNLNKI